ncbi:MAG: A/G-specific adenine glycosylase [Candidatus Chromulinivorax sp.]
MNKLSSEQIAQFQKTIYDFYTLNKRDFIWREDITPYKIIVSEIMLQQTQTSRVILKFQEWLKTFPDFTTLAQASNHEILTAWQGLGYNKRGLALGKIAQIITQEHHGLLPNDPTILQTFPAIGPNTAGSICAFAFNTPTVFIETNIRTVFTHTFFKDQANIDDKQLLPLIKQTLDQSQPREWYYALMDYGVFLKSQLPKINAASKHYTRQSKFEGSKRQVRGTIIKILTQVKHIDYESLLEFLDHQLPENVHDKNSIIANLIDEKVIIETNGILSL